MKYCRLALVLFLLAACAPQGNVSLNQEALFGDYPSQTLIQETTLTVSMNPEQISDYDALCKQLHDQIWSQGSEDLLHLFVDSAPLIRPVLESRSVASDHQEVHPLLCDPWQDQITGRVSQTAQMTATFIPEHRFAGIIQSLQDNQTMGGMRSRAYVALLAPAFSPIPIPVLIVQQSSGLEQGMMQVVGSGLITQVSDATGQMLILESTREILPGDIFFQLQIHAVTVPMPEMSLPLGLGQEDEWLKPDMMQPALE
ncbi:MAG TPA: hypothetical protein ENN39_11265 [Desulfonatronum sp.]|nr:hypothetical protein [Desulfonatronum sp.]